MKPSASQTLSGNSRITIYGLSMVRLPIPTVKMVARVILAITMKCP